ncbi:hypothetical protein NQZ79_g5279 [Umbelopsis isabellina]|nr:hypothetical protein NQZ79_g5279 [Umbelopsis isabellina]
MNGTGLVTALQEFWGYIKKMIGQTSCREHSNGYPKNPSSWYTELATINNSTAIIQEPIICVTLFSPIRQLSAVNTVAINTENIQLFCASARQAAGSSEVPL